MKYKKKPKTARISARIDADTLKKLKKHNINISLAVNDALIKLALKL